MKRLLNISTLVALLLALFALGGCTNDLDTDSIGPNKNGTSDYIVINFAAAQNDIVVQTRAQNLDDLNENRVRNLYVFIFNEPGKKVYAQYFDSSNKVDNVDGVDDDCWSVVNTNNASLAHTTGQIKIHTTSSEADTYKIYVITNLDSSFVDISSDRLSQIQNVYELLRTQGHLLQQTVSRSGYLQMSGKLENVKIASSGEITDALNNEITLQLHHMDAKVQVTLQQGKEVEELTNARIQVVNLPKVGYVWSKYTDSISTGLDAVTSPEDVFDGPLSGFDKVSQKTEEGITTNTYDAWFYMLESRQTPKRDIPMECPDASWEAYDPEKDNYNPYFERARQTKEQSSDPLSAGYGHNVVDANGDIDFVYANNLSPYMLVHCTIAMELKGEEAGQELGGDVTYLIPLGDAGSSRLPTEEKVNNFNTNRNTFYHYTITVNGVHNIRVEVDAREADLSDVEKFQPDENQPGASGRVVVAKEEIAICDCHYETRTLSFHAINIADNLTWQVNTPFGEGGPAVDIEGNDVIPPGLDYEWVHFRVNKMDKDGYYSVKRQKYDPEPYDPETNPDGLMNVSQLVKYMKEQKAIFNTEDPTMPESWSSAFDNGYVMTYDEDGNKTGAVIDDINGDGQPDRKICVTAFIDEFYYDYNPLNPLEPIPADFWKQYVNWPTDRYMYILSESHLSRDEESRSTGSVVTIQQHPIQSIYDTNPSNTTFSTAWGLEITDEDEGKLTMAYTSETYSSNRGNNDKYNGRLNTMKEWGLVDSTGTTYTSANWSTYLEEEVPNNLPQLKDAYKYLRYSCMNRNRDNDGDGIIDQNEIRWYMAALQQLTGIAVGRDVLLPESRLYNRTSEERKSDNPNLWRQHVVSSTTTNSHGNNFNSNNPEVLWGEEITSTSSWSKSKEWGGKGFSTWSVRCMRNLGTTNETLETGYDLTEEPDDYIDVDGNKITCARINPQALRGQQNTELVFCDENNEQTRLSKRFYIATEESDLPKVPTNYTSSVFFNHNQWIEDVGSSGPTSSGGTGHCPEGYRIPNMLELTIMFNYAYSYVGGGGYYISRNIYSFGKHGQYPKGETKATGWVSLPKTITVGEPPNKVRCVRDASVEELQAEGLL